MMVVNPYLKNVDKTGLGEYFVFLIILPLYYGGVKRMEIARGSIN
jgi:hypothetical protein